MQGACLGLYAFATRRQNASLTRRCWRGERHTHWECQIGLCAVRWMASRTSNMVIPKVGEEVEVRTWMREGMGPGKRLQVMVRQVTGGVVAGCASSARESRRSVGGSGK